MAYALLWAIAQWLKADEESEAVERKTQEAVRTLQAAGCVDRRPGCCPEYDKVVSAL